MSNCCLLVARIISTAAWLQSTKISRLASLRTMASGLRSNICRNMGSLLAFEGSRALGLSSWSRAIAGELMVRCKDILHQDRALANISEDVRIVSWHHSCCGRPLHTSQLRWQLLRVNRVD